jgi:LPXTG-motif cell wall-anchored protein
MKRFIIASVAASTVGLGSYAMLHGTAGAADPYPPAPTTTIAIAAPLPVATTTTVAAVLPPVSSPLPSTGTNVGDILMAGGLAALTGGGLLIVARSRSRARTQPT